MLANIKYKISLENIFKFNEKYRVRMCERIDGLPNTKYSTAIMWTCMR